MIRRANPLLLLVFFLMLAAALTALAPSERTLGTRVRVVYLHGAWVWTALLALTLSGLLGIAGGLSGRTSLQRWSLALGQTGTLFWLLYLPLSLWSMQLNWNGLYLAEPRWRIGLDFAIAAVLLQGAVLVLRSPRLAGWINAAMTAALLFSLARADQVMHPSSPIFSSDSDPIRLFFLLLVIACSLAAWQLARWLRALADALPN